MADPGTHPIHDSRWTFLFLLCWASSPLAAQENPRTDHRGENPRAKILREMISSKQDVIEGCKALLVEADRAKKNKSHNSGPLGIDSKRGSTRTCTDLEGRTARP